MSHTPRSVSAPVRILGAILAVACVGLTVVGSAIPGHVWRVRARAMGSALGATDRLLQRAACG